MKARVSKGKKGRWSVAPQVGRRITSEHLRELAHELAELPGVKRAMARPQQNRVFLRVDATVRGLYRLVKKTACGFLNRRYTAPAPRRAARTNPPNKPGFMTAKRHLKLPRPEPLPKAA